MAWLFAPARGIVARCGRCGAIGAAARGREIVHRHAPGRRRGPFGLAALAQGGTFDALRWLRAGRGFGCNGAGKYVVNAACGREWM